jgi:hypothetical protein
MEANSEDVGTGGAQRSALPASALVGATRDVMTIDAAAACVILRREGFFDLWPPM